MALVLAVPVPADENEKPIPSSSPIGVGMSVGSYDVVVSDAPGVATDAWECVEPIITVLLTMEEPSGSTLAVEAGQVSVVLTTDSRQ
jgi:hypothetical protein